jgi:hypothetical protein
MRSQCPKGVACAAVMMMACGVVRGGGTVAIRATGNGSGTVTVGGWPASDKQVLSLPWSSSVQIVATPSAGSYFSGWTTSGNAALDEPGLTTTALSLDGPCTLTVQFCKRGTASYKLTIATVGNGQVFDTLQEAKADTTYLFNNPASVVLQAVAGPGATFKGWTGSAVLRHKIDDPTSLGRSGDPNGPTVSVRVDGSVDLCATFVGGTPPIPSLGGNLSLDVRTLPADPAHWYDVEGWAERDGVLIRLDRQITATVWGEVVRDDTRRDPTGCVWRFRHRKRSDPRWTTGSWSTAKRFVGEPFSETLGDLLPGVSYVFTAQIANSKGTSEWGEERSFVTPVAAAAQVLHVDDDASGDPAPNDLWASDPLEDGSVGHPFDSLQEAINAVGDLPAVIVVHEGTYIEDVNLLGKKVTITAQWLVEHDVAGATILCGTGGTPVVTCARGETADCILQGLTITGWAEGPAVWCSGAGPTFLDCVIAGGDAGGVLCQNSGATFIDCTIGSNQGPGLVCEECRVMVTRSTVWGNASPAISTLSGPPPRVVDSDVENDF